MLLLLLAPGPLRATTPCIVRVRFLGSVGHGGRGSGNSGDSGGRLLARRRLLLSLLLPPTLLTGLAVPRNLHFTVLWRTGVRVGHAAAAATAESDDYE